MAGLPVKRRAGARETAALQHTLLPDPYGRIPKLGLSQSCPTLSQIDRTERKKAATVPPGGWPRGLATSSTFRSTCRTSSKGSTTRPAAEGEEASNLRQRLVSSQLDDGLKTESLQKLDAISHKYPGLGSFLPALEKFSTHEGFFRIREPVAGHELPVLPEPLRAEEAELKEIGERLSSPSRRRGWPTGGERGPAATWSAGFRIAEEQSSSNPRGRSAKAASAPLAAACHGEAESESSVAGIVDLMSGTSKFEPSGLLNNGCLDGDLLQGAPSSWPWARQHQERVSWPMPWLEGAGATPTVVANMHRPDWENVFWVEELPLPMVDGAGITQASWASSCRSRASIEERQKATAEQMAQRIRAPLSAAAAAGSAASVAAVTRKAPGPVLLNAAEAAKLRKRPLALSGSSPELQSLSAAAATNGWRLRSLQEVTLGSLSKS